MLRRLPSRTPSSMGYFYSPELEQAIRNACEKTPFNLIFVHCSDLRESAGLAP
jgi:hypothetical protein